MPRKCLHGHGSLGICCLLACFGHVHIGLERDFGPQTPRVCLHGDGTFGGGCLLVWLFFVNAEGVESPWIVPALPPMFLLISRSMGG